jgi:hypothetical protein
VKSTKKRIEVDYSVPVALAKELFLNFISNINLDFLLIISWVHLILLIVILKGERNILYMVFNVM